MTLYLERARKPFPESAIVSEVCEYEKLLLISRLALKNKTSKETAAVTKAKAAVGPAATDLLKTLVQMEKDALEFRELQAAGFTRKSLGIQKEEPPMPRRREAVMATRAKRAQNGK